MSSDVVVERDIWSGWRVGKVAYHVGPYPRRKRIALYRMKQHPWTDDNGVEHVGLTSLPVAYFRNEELAKEFLDWLDELAGGTQ